MATAKPKKSSAPDFSTGQRWISEMEPELGLGAILQVDHRRVTVLFQVGETVRTYTKENAPLRRVLFKSGDSIRIAGNERILVESAEEREFLFYYKTAHGTFCETQLSGDNQSTSPMDRLLSSQVDSNDDFNLRSDILGLRFRIADSPVLGYAGGRIELIPHQLYIANEVSSRFVRRVMLADEVGLGKTIEACLILHRLLVSGRVSQVLIVVPESMVYVWFVELLRKFNLRFSIIEKPGDEDGEPPETNPFSDSSLLLIGMNYFAGSTEMVRKACDVDWDVIIVDEAHHLVEGSEKFDAVRRLSQKTKDVFFLTATPQHFGERSHFARLQLLDPSRYVGFEEHCKEAEEHKTIAAITGKMLDGIDLDEIDRRRLRTFLYSENALSLGATASTRDLPESDRKQIVAEIIDRRGIGRALFRNTRAAVGGFSKRKVTIAVLASTKAQRENADEIFREDVGDTAPRNERNFSDDPRVDYLANILKEYKDDKFLVICRSKHSVVALDAALQKTINIKTSLFHEDLTLLQRDRNAAWYSEEDGARILICSEIGGEGRNFQFARHLVLFDLPANPELVEQRIGRLDRIGQKNVVDLQIPVLSAAIEEFLARWYHEGVGIFSAPVPAAQEAYERFKDEIRDILFTADPAAPETEQKIDRCIENTKKAVSEITSRLKAGRDRLLEQHSFRPKKAHEILSMIRDLDNDPDLRKTMKRLLKARGILAEEFHDDTWNLLSESQLDECFPGLDSSHSVVTFNRSKALRREDYKFLTIDHPAVTGGIDLFIGSNTGSACCAIQRKGTAAELLLEAIFVPECISAPRLFIGRFLPPYVFRILVDNKGIDRTESTGAAFFESLEDAKPFPFLEKDDIKRRLLPSMLKFAESIAAAKCDAAIQASSLKIKNVVGSEVDRLFSLQKTNPGISDKEIAAARSEYSQLMETAAKTAPRLEAVRLIWCPGR